MTQLTEVFISRKGVLAEDRSVKKAPDKIKSKVPMLLSTKQQFFRSECVGKKTELGSFFSIVSKKTYLNFSQ